ncbi:MAG: hypothetical protein JXR83_16830 [Deltaproteobacteria bacterium]|nr:hypothetical protein [Deltaproteobacteria bacterium]
MARRFQRLLLIGTLGTTAGCAQLCAPDRVAMGVAQLTVRDVGAVLTILNNDQSCGFASPAVLDHPTFTGEQGSLGAATWTVSDCAIDLGGEHEIATDCLGVATLASGKITVSATRTVSGVLTGKTDSPVIPIGKAAVGLAITEASFDHFTVARSNNPNRLTLVSGSISAKAQPLLAVDDEHGVCSVATPHVEFLDIVYQPSRVLIETPQLTEELPVATSKLHAVNGVKDKNENTIDGEITVWDSAQQIPIAGNSDGLDPDYDAQKFIDAFACTEHLAQPISYQCADPIPLLVDGGARLSVELFETLVALIDADTACGFGAAAVQSAAQVVGAVGSPGTASYSVSGCHLHFSADTVAHADCSGNQTVVVGDATVSGTKVVSGDVTGDPLHPVSPTTDHALAYSLSIFFDDFKLAEQPGEKALRAISGELTGNCEPRSALGSSGTCDVVTPIARLRSLVYADARLEVSSESGTFSLHVTSSSLGATRGTWDQRSNELSGTMTIDGERSYTVPSDQLGLDPEFDAAEFDASWSCTPELASPVSFVCQ